LNRQVFEVVEVRQLNSCKWLLRGRAYEDLKIGDDVLTEGFDAFETAAMPTFKITAISTYGHEVDELPRMLTGDLTVEGDRGEYLERATMLVAPSSH